MLKNKKQKILKTNHFVAVIGFVFGQNLVPIRAWPGFLPTVGRPGPGFELVTRVRSWTRVCPVDQTVNQARARYQAIRRLL